MNVEVDWEPGVEATTLNMIDEVKVFEWFMEDPEKVLISKT